MRCIVQRSKTITQLLKLRVSAEKLGSLRSMGSWRGVSLYDIYGSSSPWDAPEFPLVAPAYNHAVLYHINQNGNSSRTDKQPSPQRGQDKWDKDCVRMPCSTHSLYPVVEEDGSTSLTKRWDLIKRALLEPIRNSDELAEAICSYNTKFKRLWRFRALHYLFNEYLEEEETEYFFNVTLPAIASLALALPHLIQSPIPLLRQHRNRSISLTQKQIASLLANAFFCTFPRRNSHKKTSEYASYPYINFSSLYEASPSPSVMEKLKCICHYFRRVCTKMGTGVVTFTRRTVEPSACPAWESSQTLIGSVPLHVNSEGTIEDDGLGLIQIDFANKYLGGGVLNHGCVQEEIRFVICPELLVSMLFTEVLKPTEALLVIGCERYSKYTGYGDSFRWSGDYPDPAPRDSSDRIRCAVLAIDALPAPGDAAQYREQAIRRELNKAWVGFSACTSPDDASPLLRPGLATGNWGCGAFGGAPRLKALLQTMAAARARRPVAYYTFGDEGLRNDLAAMYTYLARHNVTVGQLYSYLTSFSSSGVSPSELYAYIQQRQEDSMSHPTSEHKIEEPPSTSSGVKRPLSPDLFSSSEPSSQPEPFVDLERGQATNHTQKNVVTKDKCVFEKDTEYSKLHLPHKNVDDCESKVEKTTEERKNSTLFDEMTKLDNESTKMSFNQPKSSVFKVEFATNAVSNTDATENMETSNDELPKVEEDSSTSDEKEKRPEKAEKKISKKITDYFSKKF